VAPLDVAVVVLYFVAVVALFLYGLNAYVLLAIHWWNRRRMGEATTPAPPAKWPSVTVQLPIYNERYVARRLLEAMGALDYPTDCLEIQVLDDSTDDTSAIIAEAVSRLRERGLHVVHRHRRERTGFKAGALAAGLKEARGEFLAIFDADSVPAPDFLRKTLPHFTLPQVAVVQARWGHLNREFSLLTIAQSLGIDGHFAVEQPARCWGNLLLNFNGNAGVWRRVAIEDAGGWTHDTLTEDLDLSYRAQLRGWRIVYRPELVCPAEVPVLITGFKSQQRRWAKGSIQTALKLLPMILRARLSPWAKYQAFLHLTYYTIHPAMLTVALLSVPLLRAEGLAPEGGLLLAVGLTFSLGFLGPGLLLVYAQQVLDSGWRRRVWRLPTIMIIGVGVAWSTSLAVLGAFWTKDLEFVRTPKFGIGPSGGHWRGKVYRDRHPRGGLIEIALGLYCAWSAWLLWVHQNYTALPFLALYTSGFLTVGVLTILHVMLGAGDRKRGQDDVSAPG
jgi:cellulose synthase/poly-beta-1,6-N-acetylglucosamine synthase-like glycosyltransferase